MKTAIYLVLGVVSVIFAVVWFLEARKHSEGPQRPGIADLAVGFVTIFLDTLGIGCFATITFCYKLRNMVPDELIPGTMNIGVTLAAVAEAYIYLTVDVEPVTLGSLITAAAAGSWLGAGIVAHWPRRKIQIGMGTVLLLTAGFGLARQLGMLRGGGDLLGVTGIKLALGVAATFLLGALMTLGIGFFAPCMMVIFLLGMNLKTAFPIMMASTAFVGAVGSIQFIRKARYSLGPALGLMLGGIPGVLIAAYIVKEIPLDWLRWMVIVILAYTAIMMLRTAARERRAQAGLRAA